MNAKFNLDLEHFENETGETKTETIEVTMQEASPFIVGDIFTSNSVAGGGYKVGSIVKEMMGVVIVSPKNLITKIEESDNPFVAMQKVFTEVNQFSNNPKKYVFLQAKSKAESKDLEHGNTESDANGS